MILYHGTNQDFDTIDLKKSNPYKDFGRGFYLTSLKSQAEQLSFKKARLFGGNPVLQVYSFDENVLTNGMLKVLQFGSPTIGWAEFIFKNRNRESHFSHNYDIVVGPIANDGVAYLLNRYEEGTLTIEELSRELNFKEFNNQYFFGTEASLKFIHRL